MLEIAGCYAFWAWLRLDRSPLCAPPGAAALVLFALALTRVDADFADRAFAAYGGVYIIASLAWMSLVEGAAPLWSDWVGAAVLLGARLAG